MLHTRFIYVPKTAKDMKKNFFGDENAELEKWVLSDYEFNALWNNKVLKCLNKKFDVMIDSFEEDYILYQHLYFDYEELVDDLNKFGCRNEIRMLIDMIDKAIENRTLIGFFL